MAASDFHLLANLKQFLGSTSMGSDEEVKKTVKDWQRISIMHAYRNSSHKMTST
jgi:hypothetical protein